MTLLRSNYNQNMPTPRDHTSAAALDSDLSDEEEIDSDVSDADEIVQFGKSVPMIEFCVKT